LGKILAKPDFFFFGPKSFVSAIFEVSLEPTFVCATLFEIVSIISLVENLIANN
jgi:hypothetical protein